jgi:hypothetical protein
VALHCVLLFRLEFCLFEGLFEGVKRVSALVLTMAVQSLQRAGLQAVSEFVYVQFVLPVQLPFARTTTWWSSATLQQSHVCTTGVGNCLASC